MTTPLPPQPPHDDDALPGEAELKALYDRLPPPEPAPALDAAVLRAAAQAIELPATDARARSRPCPRWPIALGTAATLVLAAGLTWQMRRLPPAAPAPSQTPTAISAPASEASDNANRVASTSGEASALREKPSAASMQAAAPASAMAAKVMPPAPARQPAPASTGHGTSPAASGAISQRMRLPPALVPRIATAPRSTGQRADAPAADHARLPAERPLPPLSPSPLKMPPPAQPPHLTASPEYVLRSELAPVAPPAPPAPTAAQAPAAPLAMPQAAPAPSTLRDAVSATPAMTRELQTIRTLYADGNATTARKLLDAFRQRYPDYPLPADLRAHLDDAP